MISVLWKLPTLINITQIARYEAFINSPFEVGHKMEPVPLTINTRRHEHA